MIVFPEQACILSLCAGSAYTTHSLHKVSHHHAERYRQVVQRRQGIGFISPEDGSADVFAHFSAINSKGFRSLQEGQRVTYDVTQGPKGAQASNITPAE